MRCFFILLSLLIGGGVLKADPSSSSRIAAIVNKSVITQTDLMNRLRLAAISSGLELTPQNLDKIKPQMLRVMIDEKLQLAEAEKDKIKITDDQIKDAIGRLEAANGMPTGYIAQLMQGNNIPLKALEDQIKANLVWVELIREKYSSTLQIAEGEVDQEVKLQKEKETKTQYHLAEIVLPFEGPEQEERVKNDLSRLIEELQNGAHFSALAQQFSQAATAAQGGDMGWLTEDQVSPEIKEFVLHMAPGQLSQPIRTPQGYVIIGYIEKKLPESEEQTLVTLQQVVLPFSQDITDEKAQAIMNIAEEISRTAKSCSALESIARDKVPSAVSNLSHQEPLSNFPEPLQKVVQQLSLHQASEPLLTEKGALLVMVCDKKSKKAEKFTEDDAREAIAERKLSLLSRRELRDLRRHAFIEVRM
ncbi:MAG: peptidylprolyl isomerase [Proteobacteria bacterium]|nr:peptidylprolyl isomerase [Pseudomonadota bacterium]